MTSEFDNSGDEVFADDRGPLPQPNPYQSPNSSEFDQLTRPSRKKPRWWTALAVPASSLLLFLVVSVQMLVVAMLIVHGHVEQKLFYDETAFLEIGKSRLGFFLVVVVPQLALIIPSIAAARLSKVPALERLGLRRGNWPLWAWLAAAAATPLVGLISSIVVGQFVEESESLKTMTDVFIFHGDNGFLIPLALMIGLTPGICEELLFRGYVQTRLNKTAGPIVGITVASLLFAAFHMDPVHIIAVFPLGCYLGFVAWRSGSILPAMLGHFVNNVVSVIAVVMAPDGKTDVLDLPSQVMTLSILVTGIIGGILMVAAAVSFPPSDETADNEQHGSLIG